LTNRDAFWLKSELFLQKIRTANFDASPSLLTAIFSADLENVPISLARRLKLSMREYPLKIIRPILSVFFLDFFARLSFVKIIVRDK